MVIFLYFTFFDIIEGFEILYEELEPQYDDSFFEI